MSSRDPERGCAYIILGAAALCLTVSAIVAILVDWRIPVLVYIVSTGIVLLTLIKLDLDEWLEKRRR